MKPLSFQMFTKSASCIALAALFASPSLKAAHPIDALDLTQIAVAGQDCQSAQIQTQNLRNDVLRLELVSMGMKAPQKGNSVSRSTCTVAIPVSLPANKKLHVKRAEAAGIVILPKNSSARLAAEVFKAGEKGDVMAKEIKGKKTGLIKVRDTKVLQSECGEDLTLRVNASVLLNNKSGQVAAAGIDSLALDLELLDCR